jgi:DNA-binding response OmpR family regulator
MNEGGAISVLQGARVLIVEDDGLLLRELELILLGAGAAIAGCCRTVKEGLAVAEKDSVTAAILDVRIGRDTVAPVARQLARRGTPFMFYSGQLEDDPVLAEWAGRKFLYKPARPSAIVAALADLLAPAGGGTAETFLYDARRIPQTRRG